MIYETVCKKNENMNDTFYVDKNQLELMDILKKKNIYSMMDLKKYIVCLIKNNKMETF